MRLFSYHDKSNKKSIGVLCKKDSDEFVDVCATDASIPTDLGSLIAMDPDLGLAKGALSNPKAIIKNLSDIQFDILIDRPGKIICMGLNYADHAKKSGYSRPEYPSFFMRGPSSLSSHQAPLIRPKVYDKLDYEAELAFVVGKRWRASPISADLGSKHSKYSSFDG